MQIKPEVTLGQYKGIEVEALSALVSDDEVMESLKAEQEKNAVMENVEDKASEDGNTVTIDFEGFVDGEAFEGGKELIIRLFSEAIHLLIHLKSSLSEKMSETK